MVGLGCVRGDGEYYINMMIKFTLLDNLIQGIFYVVFGILSCVFDNIQGEKYFNLFNESGIINLLSSNS